MTSSEPANALQLAPPAQAGVEITLRNVSRVFSGEVHAVAEISLDIPAGQFVSLIGPSGCGKSTLLRMIAGLDQPTGGTISMRRDDRETRARTAFVFQDAHLLPWRNVLRNVALPLELMRVPRSEALDAAREAIAQVGLDDAIDRYPAQLSGGMKMRVSLARALVTDPQLLLLDEPFAALDEITRQRLDEQLRELWERRGMTVIFVTHSIMEAAFLSDRAVVLSRRPARIVLDQELDLPDARVPSLRADPDFTRQMRVLYEALEVS